MFINWLIYDVANNLVKLQLLVVTSSNSSTRLHQSRCTAKDETAWIWPGEIRYPNSGYAMIIAAELRPNIPTCFGMCIYIHTYMYIYMTILNMCPIVSISMARKITGSPKRPAAWAKKKLCCWDNQSVGNEWFSSKARLSEGNRHLSGMQICSLSSSNRFLVARTIFGNVTPVMLGDLRIYY